MLWGRSLYNVTGARTERKDPYNEGTPMLAYTISDDGLTTLMKTFDAEASTRIVLLAESQTLATRRVVELNMIDWASILELEAIVVESVLHWSD
jgi:hypothetical protein